ncbi:hypothetical protein E3983_12165 [Legionella israelensis]|uniref:Uroporphyrinogen-III C-methyltransferase n=1 Tax=Legionella israelensis TaxID=454 RepID=A0AAX1EIR7_9GAMM|nr:uroporphyrinogen-III C-methyltransferase [Legionella israelensis]QBR85041.1 hypothetical protein E3983_12165 [Legionella israelensis]
MANSNEPQQKKNETDHQSGKKPKQKASASPIRKDPIHLLSLLSLLIAIVAIATAIYVLQVNKQLHQDFDQQKNTMDTRLSKLRTQQSSIQDHLKATGKSLKQAKEEIKERLDNVNQQFKLTMEQQLYENQDWMLLKARYYIELAQINAHWSDNVSTTVALLKQADMILSHINTSEVFNIRQAIAREIAQLKSKPKIDVAGLLSQLDAAQQTVRKLPLALTEKKLTEATNHQNASNETPRTWRKRLQDSVSLLEKLVVIRRHDEDIKPLLSPLYVAVIKETIQLNLQEVQWAVLNNNHQVYQIALNQAIENIKRHFDTSATITSHLIQQLNQLKNINLNQKTININESLPLLNNFIEHKKDTKVDSQTDSRGESSQ